MTLVVRGADLRPSTPVQRLLQMLLGLPEPAYLHHPLVAHDDGRRLAKRDLAPTLAAMRDAGVDGPALAADLLAGRLPLGFRLSRRLDRRVMNTLLIIALVAAMAATAYVLVRGVIAMAMGKDLDRRGAAELHAETRAVPGRGDRHRRADPAARRRRPELRPLVKLNKIYTRTGDDGSTGPGRRQPRVARSARGWPRSATSTKPIARSAWRSPRSIQDDALARHARA